ncbi:intraflagellar transport protein 88 [Pycnococcus provasolii]
MQEDDGDLYTGYAPGVADAAVTDTQQPTAQNAFSGRPGSGMASRSGMPGTGTLVGGEDGRPMTSNKGSGYKSAPKTASRRGAAGGFDPLGGSGPTGPALPTSGPLQKRSESGPEEMCRDTERKVNTLLEESTQCARDGDLGMALEKAKEAGKKERLLVKQREQHGLQDSQNIDLTYAVCFNLAVMYQKNALYAEALQTYTHVIRNKQFGHAGRLRVNMGNCYFEQRRYPNAIKMYRMALDQVPSTAKEVRFRIMRNIGHAFAKLGQYQDALHSYDAVMEACPDHATGFNLVVCCYALGDREKMKQAFMQLLSVPAPFETDDSGETDVELDTPMHSDDLHDEMRRQKILAHRLAISAARLIAPSILPSTGTDPGYEKGYDWCAQQIKDASMSQLGAEVEMAKAIAHLERRDFESAVSELKKFEKKELALRTRVATNLSFLHFLEGNVDEAQKYADTAVDYDRYNANALVNQGNCAYARADFAAARNAYLEAVGVEADCAEAIYNLGLAHGKLGDWQAALHAFSKLNRLVPKSVETLYQVAACYDALGQFRQALKWLDVLATMVPHDPGILAFMGSIHSKTGDEGRALHYYSEAHRTFPVNMDVISWLGAYHVKNEVYEKAIPYFDLASRIQPSEVKWQLMVASCYRRVGNYALSMNKYRDIHKHHPHNVECLRYLVHLCTDLGLKEEVHEYVVKLRKAERLAAEVAAAPADGPGAGEFMPAGWSEDRGGGAGLSDFAMTAPPAAEPPSPFQAPHKEQRLASGAGEPAPGGGGGGDEWGNEVLGDDLLPGFD